jgi:hypothetical protein
MQIRPKASLGFPGFLLELEQGWVVSIFPVDPCHAPLDLLGIHVELSNVHPPYYSAIAVFVLLFHLYLLAKGEVG